MRVGECLCRKVIFFLPSRSLTRQLSRAPAHPFSVTSPRFSSSPRMLPLPPSLLLSLTNSSYRRPWKSSWRLHYKSTRGRCWGVTCALMRPAGHHAWSPVLGCWRAARRHPSLTHVPSAALATRPPHPRMAGGWTPMRCSPVPSVELAAYPARTVGHRLDARTLLVGASASPSVPYTEFPVSILTGLA